MGRISQQVSGSALTATHASQGCDAWRSARQRPQADLWGLIRPGSPNADLEGLEQQAGESRLTWTDVCECHEVTTRQPAPQARIRWSLDGANVTSFGMKLY